MSALAKDYENIDVGKLEMVPSICKTENFNLKLVDDETYFDNESLSKTLKLLDMSLDL